MSPLTEPRRKLRAGIIVVFRAEDTLDELWRTRLEVLPEVDDEVGLVVDGEVATWYKVEKKVWEFLHNVAIVDEGDEGQEQPIVADYAYAGVCVLVSEV